MLQRLSFVRTALKEAKKVGPPTVLPRSILYRTMSSSLKFSSFDITEQVFLQRQNVIGIVNLKPIVPLHVLIITKKIYSRVSEIPKEELHDLIDAVQETSNLVQKLTNSSSCTISIQDGSEAGQSVSHVHVHILPRKKGDFTPNDIIYEHLDTFGLQLYQDMMKLHSKEDANKNDKRSPLAGVDASGNRKARSSEEMKSEAQWLKKEFDLIQ